MTSNGIIDKEIAASLALLAMTAENEVTMDSLQEAKAIAKILDSHKGLNVRVIKIADISSLADYMVIATGNSSTHVKSLADYVEYEMDEQGVSVSHIEGHRSDTWILLDYVDVIVHVFNEESRQYYDLDRLWEDGEEIDISDIITE